jgi:hypothetical protein
MVEGLLNGLRSSGVRHKRRSLGSLQAEGIASDYLPAILDVNALSKDVDSWGSAESEKWFSR